MRNTQGFPPDPLFPRPVRVKTFSAHVVSEIRHVVCKTGVFTHVTT